LSVTGRSATGFQADDIAFTVVQGCLDDVAIFGGTP
jgi:hypothetical protein